VLEQQPMILTREQVEAGARAFLGEIDQLPPMVSAVQVGGRRLHELARAGEEVERTPRRVRVDRFELEEFEPGAYPAATVLVECSSGTYVRSLAADLGTSLGGCAHLASLRRLRVGSFALDEAHPLADVCADPAPMVLPPAVAMRDLEPVVVDDEQAQAVSHGMAFRAGALGAAAPDAPGPLAVLDRAGALLAVYERAGGALKPAVVLT
jgi:tRNA pseudouridine55 synthase